MPGLFLVDHQAAPARGVHGAVPIGFAARVQAALHLPGKAAMGFLAQIVQVQLVDQAARDAHDLAPARQRVVSVSGADDADAPVLQALDHAFGFAQLAAEAVQPFEDQDGKAPGQRIGQHRLAARAQRDGHAATDAFVSVGRDDRPALAVCSGFRLPQLVLDGRFALFVGAVPRIEARQGCCHVNPPWVPPCSEAHARSAVPAASPAPCGPACARVCQAGKASS
ncbi:hypothetical protein M8A51_21540 [Schlegelella sp. S2-27]|uniref:Uncharacterized protein n=1 Tax=Caldimonas mangrovi TaxID=2944811 RepID=A0ABT0YTR2_9BURK|nr:hypothetical protein [Caldimonas mangrovi]MCM5682121.1 hypothetical protein [Caldimonas mangrovi]